MPKMPAEYKVKVSLDAAYIERVVKAANEAISAIASLRDALVIERHYDDTVKPDGGLA